MALPPLPPLRPGTCPGPGAEGTNSNSASRRIIAAVRAKDRHIERHRLLSELTNKVLVESSAEIAVGTILEDAPAILEAGKFTLWLWEDMSFHGYSAGSGVQVLSSDVGVPGYIMVTGESLNIPDLYSRPELLTQCEAQFGLAKSEGCVALLAAPLRDEFGSIVGVVEARQKTASCSSSSASSSSTSTVTSLSSFTTTDERLLASLQALLTQQIRIAELTNAKMKADLRTDNALSLMDNICRTGTLDEVVVALSLAANDLIDCQLSLVFLKEKTSLICYANSAYDSEDHEKSHELRLSSSEPILKEVLATGRPLVVNRESHSEELERLTELLSDTLVSAGFGETRRDRGSVSMMSIPSMSCILQSWPTYINSVLCSPLRSSDGEVFGLVLAVNRRCTPAFASEGLGSSQAPNISGPPARPDNGAAVLSALLRSNLSTCESLQAPSAAMEVEVGDFQEADEMQLSLLLRLSSHVIQISKLLTEQQRAAVRKEALLTLVSDGKSAVADKDPRRFAVEIVAKSLVMFDCDRCTFFTVDTLNDELVGYYTASDSSALKELRLPIRGIAGTVATSNTMLNIPDAWADERFSNEVDLRMNYRTKTLLCAPLATSSGKVIAILQCINKKSNLVFNEEDEQLLLTVSALLSDMLQRMMLEGGYASFVQLNDNINSDVKDMFSQYQKEAPKGAEPEAQPPRKAVSASRLRLHKAVSTMSDVTQGVKILRRWDLDVNPLVEDPVRSLSSIRACFSYYGLLVRFNMAADALDAAVQAIRSRYYANVHYHNWVHAFATMHATFLFLETAAFSSLLPETDVFALLLSALGHDVEHPGYTNAFMVNSRSRLAIVYNDRAVLESHHASVTTSIMECDTKLLSAMSKEEVQRVRQVVVQTILGTDMALHQECIQWLETEAASLDLPSSRSSETQLSGDPAVRLATAMLHSADLVHPALHWSVHRHRSIQIALEFFAQFEEETTLGLPTLPFMGKEPTNLNALAPIQTGFIQFVAMPLWSALNTAAGNDLLRPLLDNISENRKKWQQLCDGEPLEEQAPFKVPVFAETRGNGFASGFRRSFMG